MEISSKRFTARRTGRDLRLVCTAAFFAWMGFGICTATFQNFAVNVIHIQPEGFGVLESIRETPGLAMAFVLALAMHIAEPKLAAGAFLLMALGFLGYSHTSTYTPLVIYSLLWSIGLHCWMPLQSAMTLSLAEEGSKARRLGQVGAWAGLGTATGMGSVMLLSKMVTFSSWYTAAAIAVVIASGIIWFVRRDLTPPDKPRLVFKRKYGLFYGLTFLEGCRKQVFISFAPFALVHVYNTPLKIMAALMLINNIVNVIGSPIIGKLIDRVGERRILIPSYSLLILVFIGYAVIDRAHVLFVLFCMDSLLYLSTIGLTSYLNRIADPEDIVPSLSMGVTMNHLAAVIVPVTGGLLWAKVGYPITFFGGAVVVILSILLASRIKKPCR